MSSPAVYYFRFLCSIRAYQFMKDRDRRRLQLPREDEFKPALFRAPEVVTADELRDAAASADVAVFATPDEVHRLRHCCCRHFLSNLSFL